MIHLRPHRGGLAASLADRKAYNTPQDAFNSIKEELAKWCFHATPEMVTSEPYAMDHRIPEHTHLVYVKGYGVYGQADCNFMKELKSNG